MSIKATLPKHESAYKLQGNILKCRFLSPTSKDFIQYGWKPAFPSPTLTLV